MTFRIEYGNEGCCFREWWTVTDDIRSFKCDAEADAIWLRDLINGLRPLFDSMDPANGKPVSKMWADDLNIQLGGGGGSGSNRNGTIYPPTPPHHKKPDKPTA